METGVVGDWGCGDTNIVMEIMESVGGHWSMNAGSGSVPVGDEEGWEEVTSFLDQVWLILPSLTPSSWSQTAFLYPPFKSNEILTISRITLVHWLLILFSRHCLIVKSNSVWQHYTGMCRWWVLDLTRQSQKLHWEILHKRKVCCLALPQQQPLTQTVLYWKTNGRCLPHCSFVIHFHIGAIFAISICPLDNKYKQTFIYLHQ